ncbi:MAG: hypothetical protein GY846_12920, partial [Deltaproteobacteria bacterium]|nr:hypothetical protein [Deltaproteobacteria bacterium]
VRVQTLRQMFNAKHQVDVAGFRMSERAIGNPPLREGPVKEVTLEINEMIRIYNKVWGWDEKSGYPKNDTVAGLNLNTLLSEPYNYG